MATRPVVIVGNGRSGTNWVMEVLNASPRTFCRNEPQEIDTSPLQPLLNDLVLNDRPLLKRKWDAFLTHSASHCGERDTTSLVCKDYFHAWSYHLGLVDFLRRPKIRQAIKSIYPTLPAEWGFPFWAGSRSKLKQAKLVVKINDLPAWLFKALLDYDNTCFIHVLRHPAAQANSGLRRHFSKLSDEQTQSEVEVYRMRLAALCRHFPEYRFLESRLDQSNLFELSSWFWKVNNEAIWSMGKSASADVYLPVVYESLVAAPDESIEKLYEHADVPLTQETIRLNQTRREQSVWGKLPDSPEQVARAWRTQLPANLIDFIDGEILSGSPLEHLWELA